MKRLSGSEKLPELSKKPACEYSLSPCFSPLRALNGLICFCREEYSSARVSHFFIHFFGAHCTTMTFKLPSATYEFLCLNLNTVFKNSTPGKITHIWQLSGSNYTLETTNIHFLATFSQKSSWRLLKLSLGWELVSLQSRRGFLLLLFVCLFFLSFSIFQANDSLFQAFRLWGRGKENWARKNSGGRVETANPSLFFSSSFLLLFSLHSPFRASTLHYLKTPWTPGSPWNRLNEPSCLPLQNIYFLDHSSNELSAS